MDEKSHESHPVYDNPYSAMNHPSFSGTDYSIGEGHPSFSVVRDARLRIMEEGVCTCSLSSR